jgi:hypothetical protein
MRILERLGERGDPTIAQRQLGTPTTTAQQWCQQRASCPTTTSQRSDDMTGTSTEPTTIVLS